MLHSSSASSADLCPAGSIAFKDAGAAFRLFLDRAIPAALNGTQRRVLSAVVSLTATYSKYFVRTFVAQIARTAELDRTDPKCKTTRRAMRKLTDLGLMVYEPSIRHGKRKLIGLSVEQTSATMRVAGQ